jgi:Na+/H+ antiporter NhaC
MWDLYTQGTTKNPSAQSISDIISSADGYDAMLHASIAALVSAYVLSVLYKISTTKISQAIHQSTERILEAISILILAWSIGTVMDGLGSATFLVQVLDGVLLVQWLPTVLFVVSAGIAFATGTSFGTMGTIIPLAIPLAMQSGANYEILLASIASVLSGATWGDHCSPISDTTVLSSVGADCDHAKHVETQLPYALVSGLISILCCSIPVGFGLPWYLCVIVATVVSAIVIWIVGKPMSTPDITDTH